jgi:hypothetical protein
VKTETVEANTQMPTRGKDRTQFLSVLNSVVNSNYIYRWNRRDVHKTVSSCIPEIGFSVVTHPYWDFNIDEYELSLRQKTRIGLITSLMGPRAFLKMLRGAKRLLNVLPLTERQGNKFFCVVKKHAELQPRLSRENGEVVFSGDRNGMQGEEIIKVRICVENGRLRFEE